MSKEIDVSDMLEVLRLSDIKKSEMRRYDHPLLLYINYIEAMIKCGALHRTVAEYFNKKLELTKPYNNDQLSKLRYSWKKKGLIDYDIVKIIMDDIKSVNNKNNTWENI